MNIVELKQIDSFDSYQAMVSLLQRTHILEPSLSAGWTSALVGGGGRSLTTTYSYLSTSATASSSAHVYSGEVSGFMQGGGSIFRVNWGKRLDIFLYYTRTLSDAQVVSRFQLKEANSIGALAAKGIGIRADNLALTGESYGTVLGEVDLSVTLTTAVDKLIHIVHNPDIAQIEWYVDDVLQGTQTTATKVPSGIAGADSFLTHSIANGVTGGVNALSVVAGLILVQKR